MTGRNPDETGHSRSKRPDERPDETRTGQGRQFVRSVGGYIAPTPDETPVRQFEPSTMIRCREYRAPGNADDRGAA
jgi:hypothetical protein